ncbi:MAG: hypothetical protein FWC67_04905, partial [Defluviitaleaceae bacterium]|nr:hypothetical protein [Defluviitaleaceae bacterium]
MNFCGNCGTEMEKDTTVCANCGKDAAPQAPPQKTANPNSLATSLVAGIKGSFQDIFHNGAL